LAAGGLFRFPANTGIGPVNGGKKGKREKGKGKRESGIGCRREYHQLMRVILNMILYLVVVPIMLTAALYAFMWTALCLFRFIPMIGRKHRHSDWSRLNK
jgi:hypothetical protein